MSAPVPVTEFDVRYPTLVTHADPAAETDGSQGTESAVAA